MVRNGVKPGEAYNPYQATFIVPPGATKNDIKSYLLAVYGVETTYINTEIPHQKGQQRGQPLAGFNPVPKFKRAIVGLVEPFYYPDDPADMSSQEFQDYEGDHIGQGRTVMQNMRKLSSRGVTRLPTESPGEYEDAMEKKARKLENTKNETKLRREAVTNEVISLLTSTSERRGVHDTKDNQ